MTLDPDRRASLLGAELRALVAPGWPSSDPGDQAGSFPGGATLWRGSEGWVLADERPERALGPALAWARQHDLDHVHVLVDRHAGLLARRAELFVRAPSVWSIAGGDIHPAVPDPVTPPAPLSDAVNQVAALLDAHGLEVVVDHGEVTGELLGLEVARVVTRPDGSAGIEVGVGRHDREAFAMMHGDRDPADALGSVIETVGAHRRPGAPAHPLNRLAAERWLRARLVAEPGLVGARHLVAVEGAVPRASVKDTYPAAAVGTDLEGAPVVVVASTGIDLDLVPTAADARLAHAPGARLVLVVPARDAHPVTAALAAALLDPAELVTVADDWRA